MQLAKKSYTLLAIPAATTTNSRPVHCVRCAQYKHSTKCLPCPGAMQSPVYSDNIEIQSVNCPNPTVVSSAPVSSRSTVMHHRPSQSTHSPPQLTPPVLTVQNRVATDSVVSQPQHISAGPSPPAQSIPQPGAQPSAQPSAQPPSAIVHFRTFFAQFRTFFSVRIYCPISHLFVAQSRTFFVQFRTYSHDHFLSNLAPFCCPISHLF